MSYSGERQQREPSAAQAGAEAPAAEGEPGPDAAQQGQRPGQGRPGHVVHAPSVAHRSSGVRARHRGVRVRGGGHRVVAAAVCGSGEPCGQSARDRRPSPPTRASTGRDPRPRVPRRRRLGRPRAGRRARRVGARGPRRTPTRWPRCATRGCWCPWSRCSARSSIDDGRARPRQVQRHGHRAAHRARRPHGAAGVHRHRAAAGVAARRPAGPGERADRGAGRRSRTAPTPSWSTSPARCGSSSRATTCTALAAGWQPGRVGDRHGLDSARGGMSG